LKALFEGSYISFNFATKFSFLEEESGTDRGVDGTDTYNEGSNLFTG
jgi:hypothetical protein